VELLRAYLNTPPELDEIMRSLSELPADQGVDAAGSATSPPRKLRSRLPRSIVSKIVADYQAGSSSRELSAKYELPKSSVLVILKKEGVTRPEVRLTDNQIEAAVRLIQDGKSVSIAATELDVAVRTLYHQLKVRGLPTRAALQARETP